MSHAVVRIVVPGAEISPFDFAADGEFRPRLQLGDLLGDCVPLGLVHDDARQHEEAVLNRFCRAPWGSAFIDNKQEHLKYRSNKKESN